MNQHFVSQHLITSFICTIYHSIDPFIHPSIHVSIHSSIHLSVYPSKYLPMHPFIPIHTSIYLFIYSLSLLFIQRKCAQYWPEKVNETLETSSHISVTLLEIIPFANFEQKIFHVVKVSLLTCIQTFLHSIYYVPPQSTYMYMYQLSFLLSFFTFLCPILPSKSHEYHYVVHCQGSLVVRVQSVSK